MSSARSREMAQFVRRLVEAGCTAEISRGGGHWKIRHPDKPGETYVMPHSPGGNRSMPNCVAGIRRTFGIRIKV